MHALDPWIELDHYRLRYSTLRYDRRARNVHLGVLYEASRTVRCLCLSHGIEMAVGWRKTAGAYYLFHARREQAATHALQCPHRSYSDESAADTATQSDTPRPSTSTRSYQEAQSAASLLDRLILKARLSFWRPEFAGKRTYPRVRFKLVEAAKKIELKPGLALSDCLYMPPQYLGPDSAPAIAEDWRDFVSLLRPQAESFPSGYVVGVLRALERDQVDACFVLKLLGSSVPFRIFDTESPVPNSTYDGPWLVIMQVERASTNRVRVRAVAATCMSPSYVPVLSPDFARLATDLVAAGESFTAPLMCDDETVWAFPNFLLYRPEKRRVLAGLNGMRSADAPA